MKIMELDNKEGMWHFSSHSDRAVRGILNLNNGKLQLTISRGNFYNKFFFREELGKGVTICGELYDGKKLTMLGCNLIKHEVSFSPDTSMDYELYVPSSIVDGAWIESDATNSFTGAAAYYPILNEWSKDFRCLLKETYGDVGVTRRFSSDGLNIHKDLQHDLNIVYINDSSGTVEQVIEKIDDIAKFITCLLGKRCIYENSIFLKKGGDWLELVPNYTRTIDCTLDGFIRYRKIEDDFDKILTSWWAKKRELAIPIALFTDSCINKTWELIPEFLKMVQALEVYSRRINMPPLMPVEDFNNMINTILSDVKDKQHKIWLEKTLKSYKGYNEPTCVQRHRKLYEEMSEMIGINISKNKIKSISFKIVETRNYYTHFGDDKHIYKTDEQICYATTFMKYLLWAYILKEFEIPINVIAEHMNNANEFHFALYQLTDGKY